MNNPIVFRDSVLESLVRAHLGIHFALSVLKADARPCRCLFLGNAEITDLNGLQYFTNLEFLDISGNAITDLSPLSGLKKLKMLSMVGCPITDYSPLAALPLVFLRVGKPEGELIIPDQLMPVICFD